MDVGFPIASAASWFDKLTMRPLEIGLTLSLSKGEAGPKFVPRR
jgi:hypothetical protein